jgi:hypothetical protein
MIVALTLGCVLLAIVSTGLALLYARERAAVGRAQVLERDVQELADDIESAAAEQDRERIASNARAAVTRKELDHAYEEIRARRDPGDARRGLRELFGAMSHPSDTGASSDNQDDDPTLPDRKR